jgi:hypothetical protein
MTSLQGFEDPAKNCSARACVVDCSVGVAVEVADDVRDIVSDILINWEILQE